MCRPYITGVASKPPDNPVTGKAKSVVKGSRKEETVNFNIGSRPVGIYSFLRKGTENWRKNLLRSLFA
jgi:hypothetical protein